MKQVDASGSHPVVLLRAHAGRMPSAHEKTTPHGVLRCEQAMTFVFPVPIAPGGPKPDDAGSDPTMIHVLTRHLGHLDRWLADHQSYFLVKWQ